MIDQLYNIRYLQSGGKEGLFDKLIANEDLVFDIIDTFNPLPVSVREFQIGATFEPKLLITTTKLPLIGIEWTLVPNQFQNTNGIVPPVRYISTRLTFESSISKNVEGVEFSISGGQFVISVGPFNRSYTVDNIDQLEENLSDAELPESIKGPLLEVVGPLVTAAKLALNGNSFVDA